MRKFLIAVSLMVGMLSVPTAAHASSECVSTFEWNYVTSHDIPKIEIHREFDFAGKVIKRWTETPGSGSADYPSIVHIIRVYRGCEGASAGRYGIEYTRLVYVNGPKHLKAWPSWSVNYRG